MVSVALAFRLQRIFSAQGLVFYVEHGGPVWWAGHAEWAPESGVLGVLFGAVLVVVVWCATRGASRRAEASGAT